MICIEMICKYSNSLQKKVIINLLNKDLWFSYQETFLNIKIKTSYCLCFIVN